MSLTQLCSIDGCTKNSRKRGGGGMHGDTAEERFWATVDKTGTCWLWTARLHPSGYGYFSPGGSRPRVASHRWAYEQGVGPLPEGMVLSHLCRALSCVNPAHLEPITYRKRTLQGKITAAMNARKKAMAAHPETMESRLMRAHLQVLVADRAWRSAAESHALSCKNPASGFFHSACADAGSLYQSLDEATKSLYELFSEANSESVCTHLNASPDETGHCSRCGRQWPTYGPERLPFP